MTDPSAAGPQPSSSLACKRRHREGINHHCHSNLSTSSFAVPAIASARKRPRCPVGPPTDGNPSHFVSPPMTNPIVVCASVSWFKEKRPYSYIMLFGARNPQDGGGGGADSGAGNDGVLDGGGDDDGGDGGGGGIGMMERQKDRRSSREGTVSDDLVSVAHSHDCDIDLEDCEDDNDHADEEALLMDRLDGDITKAEERDLMDRWDRTIISLEENELMGRLWESIMMAERNERRSQQAKPLSRQPRKPTQRQPTQRQPRKPTPRTPTTKKSTPRPPTRKRARPTPTKPPPQRRLPSFVANVRMGTGGRDDGNDDDDHHDSWELKRRTTTTTTPPALQAMSLAHPPLAETRNSTNPTSSDSSNGSNGTVDHNNSNATATAAAMTTTTTDKANEWDTLRSNSSSKVDNVVEIKSRGLRVRLPKFVPTTLDDDGRGEHCGKRNYNSRCMTTTTTTMTIATTISTGRLLFTRGQFELYVLDGLESYYPRSNNRYWMASLTEIPLRTMTSNQRSGSYLLQAQGPEEVIQKLKQRAERFVNERIWDDRVIQILDDDDSIMVDVWVPGRNLGLRCPRATFGTEMGTFHRRTRGRGCSTTTTSTTTRGGALWIREVVNGGEIATALGGARVAERGCALLEIDGFPIEHHWDLIVKMDDIRRRRARKMPIKVTMCFSKDADLESILDAPNDSLRIWRRDGRPFDRKEYEDQRSTTGVRRKAVPPSINQFRLNK